MVLFPVMPLKDKTGSFIWRLLVSLMLMCCMFIFIFPLLQLLLTVILSSPQLVCGGELRWPFPDRSAAGCGVTLQVTGLLATLAH